MISLIILFRNTCERIFSVGTRESYHHWENQLVKKLNIIAITGLFNVLGATLIVYLMGIEYLPLTLLVMAAVSLVYFLLIIYSGYISAAYFIFTLGFTLSVIIAILLGLKSGSYLLFFPLIFCAFQLFVRKELLKHLIAIFAIAIGMILISVWTSVYPAIINDLSVSQLNVIYSLHLFFCILITIQFSLAIASANIQNEERLTKIVREKEIILAEMFHRVKNNLNVIISIINLKKNISEDPETQNALEEIKHRIYAISMIHQKVFTNNNELALDMSSYIHELCNYTASTSPRKHSNFSIDTKGIHLDFSKAMPCGMIINELITNSFKHIDSKKALHIRIEFQKNKQDVILSFKDNGTGMVTTNTHKSSLGMILIEALSEQIDGEFSFENKDGLAFQLKFQHSN